MIREILRCGIFGPRFELKVTPSEVKRGASEPLSIFRFLGIEGVRGTHIRDHEVMKLEIPFQVKTLVTLVGH